MTFYLAHVKGSEEPLHVVDDKRLLELAKEQEIVRLAFFFKREDDPLEAKVWDIRGPDVGQQIAWIEQLKQIDANECPFLEGLE